MNLIKKTKPKQDFIDLLKSLIESNRDFVLSGGVKTMFQIETERRDREYLVYRGYKMSPTKLSLPTSNISA